MPATAAQVFGPTTVNPSFNITGERTLLTMNTTLPAGGKNVVIVVFGRHGTLDTGTTGTTGTYRIYKGATLLYESKITEIINSTGMRAKHAMIIAVDDAPAGNDRYSFRINIATAGISSDSVHVQGLVIKTNDASWAFNTTAISIDAGATATVTSMTTAFPINSKVALVAVVYGSWEGTGQLLIGVGNVKLKAGTTVVASSQFNIGSFTASRPIWVSLVYLDTPTTTSQTYSVEVTNDSSQTFNFYAEIVAFTVSDGAFLDTDSVALTNGVQVTVGNLATTLSGIVITIGLAAAENTESIDVIAFNPSDVVLQLNNSVTGQIGNLTRWFLERTTYHGRSGILPFFRIDTNVTNPSYQIKMTARGAGINGEAKILAFSLAVVVTVNDSGVGVESVGITVSVGDIGSSVDGVSLSGSIPVSDGGSGVETALLTIPSSDIGVSIDVGNVSTTGLVSDTGTGVETVLVTIQGSDVGASSDVVNISSTIPVSDTGYGTEFVTSGFQGYFTDAGGGIDSVSKIAEALDAGSGIELVDTIRQIFDIGLGSDSVDMTRNLFDDGSGIDIVSMTKEVKDSGSGADNIPFLSREIGDTGSGVELVDISRQIFDNGSGIDIIVSPQFNTLSDVGIGFEIVSTTIPQFDTGVGRDIIGMTKEVKDAGIGSDNILFLSKDVLESGVGVETINLTRGITDSGLGVDMVNMTKFMIDSGLGVDQVSMTKEVKDAGASIETVSRTIEVRDTSVGVETITSIISAIVQDSAIGMDVIGLVSIVNIYDASVGVDLAETQLSIYGVVTLDNNVIVGVHSIPYRDLARDGLPIQTQRRFVNDRVYVDGVEVGVVTVEWEDKVADIVPGVRTIRVAGVVRLVE
jgi:hypothetical protein